MGEEGVEEGVSHSDSGPLEPEEDNGEAHLLVFEQGGDAVAGELAEGVLDDFHGGHLGADNFLGFAADLVEDVFAEPGLGLVPVGDAVDDSDGFTLAAAREEVLRGLEEVEEEEAAEKHDEGDGAQGEDEVTPSPVLILCAWVRIRRAGEVGDKSPSEERSNELAKGPEGR